jgi:hypothetical protein
MYNNERIMGIHSRALAILLVMTLYGSPSVVLGAFQIDQVGTLLEQLKGTNQDTRIETFYKLQHIGFSSDPRIIIGIIGLLSDEEDYIDTGSINEDDNETYSSYHFDLIDTVVSFQDQRAIPALVKALATGGVVMKGIAAFGPIALDPVIDKTTSGDDELRDAATITFRVMLSPDYFPQFSDPISKGKIKAALDRLSGDSSALVRESVTKVREDYSRIDVPGDLNGDLHVDCADVSVVKAAFGRRRGQPGFDVRADVNIDNVVDVRDLAFVTQKLPLGTRCQ